MKNMYASLLYTIFIIAGAVMVFLEESRENNRNVFILCFGFILLMFGLYKATTQWVKDNKPPSGEKDDTVFFEEDKE